MWYFVNWGQVAVRWAGARHGGDRRAAFFGKDVSEVADGSSPLSRHIDSLQAHGAPSVVRWPVWLGCGALLLPWGCVASPPDGGRNSANSPEMTQQLFPLPLACDGAVDCMAECGAPVAGASGQGGHMVAAGGAAPMAGAGGGEDVATGQEASQTGSSAAEALPTSGGGGLQDVQEPGGETAGAASEAPDDTADVGGDWLSTEAGREPAPGEVVFSEFMVDPAALGDIRGEWVEVHSLVTKPIELGGCVLLSGSARVEPLPAPLRLAPGGFLALARSELPGFESAVVTPLVLHNAGGTLELRCAEQLIDRVRYGDDGGPASRPGESLMVRPEALAQAANDNAEDYCRPTVAMATGDLATPGAENGGCAEP